jgi:hypothetical protein
MTDFLIQVTCAAHTPLALGVIAETHKFQAEANKLQAEASKFQAEAPKLRVDRWIAPPLVVAPVIGGTIVAAANHFLGAH